MMKKTDIGFESDFEENISAVELEKMYGDTINIWLAASGANDQKAGSSFRAQKAIFQLQMNDKEKDNSDL